MRSKYEDDDYERVTREERKENKRRQKEKEKIKRERTFPKKNTILIVFIALLQIAVIIFAVQYRPKPKDIIEKYEITVEPQENGDLDIEYSFVWMPLDKLEKLSWVRIGMPNGCFVIDESSFSQNISYASHEAEDNGYVCANIYFKEEYSADETFEFSFKIHQSNMLCTDGNYHLYRFIPGWFNSIPINNYTVRWKDENTVGSNCNDRSDGYLVWQGGQLEPGDIINVSVNYPDGYFNSYNVLEYTADNQLDANNDLNDDRQGIIFLCVILILVGVGFEVFVFDSYISYARGRGFIRSYGYPVHTYGRTNPVYIRERARRSATTPSHGSGGSFHGGCACACACACAGGGRAGCSQKDTYESPN